LELDALEEQSLLSLVTTILILLVKAAEIFSLGTTIQNRGIIHAGYDGTAGTNHTKNFLLVGNTIKYFCSSINNCYQKKGSLVVHLMMSILEHF
jgi:L-2-hydroxyglutarate oxidase LhgO